MSSKRTSGPPHKYGQGMHRNAEQGFAPASLAPQLAEVGIKEVVGGCTNIIQRLPDARTNAFILFEKASTVPVAVFNPGRRRSIVAA
jgi:hypothetical protein